MQIGIAWPLYTVSQHETQLGIIKDERGFTDGLNNFWSAKIKQLNQAKLQHINVHTTKKSTKRST